ncbi:unnamed protein product, partial [Effrenium voratum]
APGAKSGLWHVPLSAILYACWVQRYQPGRRPTALPLQEVIDALRATFCDVPAEEVQVTLLGGYQKMDHDTALQKYNPASRERQYFSWHVVNDVKQ